MSNESAGQSHSLSDEYDDEYDDDDDGYDEYDGYCRSIEPASSSLQSPGFGSANIMSRPVKQ